MLVRGHGWSVGYPGKCYPLDRTRGLTVGNHPRADIAVRDDTLSDICGRFGWDGTQWLYTAIAPPDANPRVVPRPVPLRPGRSIEIGREYDRSISLTFLSGSDLDSAYRKLVQANGLFLDPHTRLFHRDYLRFAVCEYARALYQDGGTLWALFIDIDHFKRLNDLWGFAVGNVVLEGVARSVSKCIHGGAIDLDPRSAARPNELDRLAGRAGGEEFMVLVRNISREEAVALAEEIRAEVANTPITAEGFEELESTEGTVDGAVVSMVSVTVSIGVVAWQPSWTYPELARRADNAMYAAKCAGRNRVFVPGS